MRRLIPAEIRQAYRYLGKTKVNRPFLVISVALSAATAFVALYLIRLLFPLMEGIITRNFEAVRSLAILRHVTGAFPDVFSHSSALFILLVAWVYVISVTKSALNYVQSLLVRREALVVARQMRTAILDRYLRFGKLFFDRTDTSHLVWQATNCNRWIEGLFVAFQSLLSGLLEVAVYLSIMTVVSWQLTLSVILALPLFRIGRLLVGRIQQLSTQYMRALTNLQSRLTELLSFLTLVRTSGQTEQERTRFLKVSDEEFGVALRVHRVSSLTDPVQEITGTTALLFMAVCLSFFIGNTKVESAQLFVFFFLVMRTIPVFNSLARFRTMVARETASARAFDELMKDDGKHIVPSGTRPFTGRFEKIEIRGLTFSYVPGNRVLQNLSVTIPQGGMIGLVGPTGSGKTTLVHLLFRFYDCPPGAITIDGTDIREFDIDSLRAHMALLSQDAPVLQDTIRANILYSVSTPPAGDDFERVLDMARLRDVIARLPEGLDTVVGERGATLSGGERQRIAIARALLKGASILVLDEPTSALDPENERLIAEATLELARGRTTIVIAHRMSTIRKADTVIVLGHGTVVQQGPPEELADREGPYREFVRAQSGPGG